jgi:hypothetical protein
VDIRWTLVVTYSTGVALLLASKAVEGMVEPTTAESFLLLAGFVVLYLVSNLSLIRIDLANPISNPEE